MKIPETDTLQTQISLVISEAIKTLCQEMHLYQSIKIKYEHLIANKDSNLMDRVEAKNVSNFLKEIWYFSGEENVLHKEIYGTEIFIELSTIKIYCEICKRIEPFNPGPFPCKRENNTQNGATKFNQLFTFHFQCQSCHQEITSFLVKQKEDKLQLVGRSPIEHVEIKKYFPKNQGNFISDAIVAHQSGQTLAGLFFLRVFVEQFCVSKINGKNSRVDEIIKEYDNGLPEDFRSHFPSLYTLYGKLSEAIHMANASQILFTEVLSNIEKHFDAKRIYGL